MQLQLAHSHFHPASIPCSNTLYEQSAHYHHAAARAYVSKPTHTCQVRIAISVAIVIAMALSPGSCPISPDD